MTLRSYAGKFMSWTPREIDIHEVEPNYFDFVTYCGLISLSMGTILSHPSRATSKATPANEQAL